MSIFGWKNKWAHVFLCDTTKTLPSYYTHSQFLPFLTIWYFFRKKFYGQNFLYLDYVNEPTIQNKTKYDKMKQFCEKHKNDAKRSYYKNLFDEHSDNSRCISVILSRQKLYDI